LEVTIIVSTLEVNIKLWRGNVIGALDLSTDDTELVKITELSVLPI